MDGVPHAHVFLAVGCLQLSGVEKSIQLQLSDDSVPYEEIRSTSGNKHRANWRGLAVKDSANTVLGGWSTVYDEGEHNMICKFG